ncbi:PrsW family glutamic-type intramembrane protease [Streptomyces sp. NBC_01766]|uniref:PrsW family intramembrane metalloprotease n=1 Tax=Streptomyces sp. NBC_01766 TaxID=2975936 RepID=UPI003FA3CD34
MYESSSPPGAIHPVVPAYEEQPRFDAVPPRAHWRYKPRKDFWRSKALRASAVIVLLALCGLLILSLVREQTGTEGFLVGLGLAVLPVPLLMAAFRWLDRVDPGPWSNLLFAFAWGACAAALVAIIANSFATHWIATATADPSSADTLGATVVAPVVEESAKAAAVLLIFLFRRRHFTGLVDGVVFAGFTATGFAFTENILYLGSAFGEDKSMGFSGVPSVTAATFFVRAVVAPFAHPLFTVLTGIGFGLSALATGRRRLRRYAPPLLGLVCAMGMHALWNSSSVFGTYGFYLVYGVFMVPVFGVVTWLAIWTRQRELRTISTELPAYAAAGWLAPEEPLALSSMRARAMARGFAARTGAAGTDPRGQHLNAQPNPYGQASPYGQPNPYAQPSSYVQPAPYAQPTPYATPSPAPYADPVPYANPAPHPNPVPYADPAHPPSPPSPYYPYVRPQPSAVAKARAKAASRAVSEYEAFATTLAFLRHRARRGAVGPDFEAREQELLHHLWQRKEIAGPALLYAARATGRVRVAPPYPYYGSHHPYQR